MKSHENILDLVKQVASTLSTSDFKLVTAESCTGGWIAKSCTDLPGSSTWFDRGYVCYSNDAKQEQLNVNADTLIKYGAVSQQTVEQMAAGALKHSQAHISVAVTGIAGPDGGTPSKPVGTVWIAWAINNGAVLSECFLFTGDRDSIRQQTVCEALKGIIKNARDCQLSMG